MKKLLSFLVVCLLCFGACGKTEGLKSGTGVMIQPGGSVLVSCTPQGGSQPAPTSLGGSTPGAGGTRATGGNNPAGGGISTGGSVVVFPGCNSAEEHAAKPAHHHRHHLGGKITKPRPPRAAESAGVTGASVFYGSPCTALDQGENGSCTGDDATQTSSTPPYKQACATATQAAALQCYEDATNLDNGCAWNATCSACPAAFCPATNANDNGSYATSAFQAAKYLGWFTGTRAVTQSIQGWHDALLLGPCGFDQNWTNVGFTPSTCGEVSYTGPVIGGHSTEAVGFDVANQRMWLRNSWGDWGVKDGYFFYSYATLQKLLAAGASMVCPAVP